MIQTLTTDCSLLTDVNFDPCFNWEEARVDVAMLRNTLFEAKYLPSEKQEDMLRDLETKQRLVKASMNQKSYAETQLAKCGIHDEGNRVTWEGKVIESGNRIFEQRQLCLEISVNLAKSLGWLLSSGMAHSLVQDVSGAADGSYNVLHDNEARMLYDDAMRKSDEEFYESVNKERADKLHFYRPENIKNMTLSLARDNVAKIKQMMSKLVAEYQEGKLGPKNVRKKSDGLKEEQQIKPEEQEADPLDAYMTEVQSELSKLHSDSYVKQLENLINLYDSYKILLHKYYQQDIPAIDRNGWYDDIGQNPPPEPKTGAQTTEILGGHQVDNKSKVIETGPYSNSSHNTAIDLIASVLARKKK